MAAPTTNFKPFCGIGIYRAPEGCPREEFEANMRGFLDIMQSTPAVQKNLLKLNAVYQNDHLKEAVDRAGLKEAPTTVLAIAECKAAEDFANCMKDVDVTGHVRNTNSFGMPQAACFFSADVVTKLDHGKCLTGETTCHGIFIFKIPEGYHTDVNDYRRKVEAIFDKIGSLPVAEEHLVKHTIWFQTPHMEGPSSLLGFQEAEKTVVAMLETENWKNMNAILGHPAIKTILAEAHKDFGIHEDSHCFTADVKNLVYNHDKNSA